jgi:hypothetical protein
LVQIGMFPTFLRYTTVVNALLFLSQGWESPWLANTRTCTSRHETPVGSQVGHIYCDVMNTAVAMLKKSLCLIKHCTMKKCGKWRYSSGHS